MGNRFTGDEEQDRWNSNDTEYFAGDDEYSRRNNNISSSGGEEDYYHVRNKNDSLNSFVGDDEEHRQRKKNSFAGDSGECRWFANDDPHRRDGPRVPHLAAGGPRPPYPALQQQARPGEVAPSGPEGPPAFANGPFVMNHGSLSHSVGNCSPCAFLHKDPRGCLHGRNCKFCHICPPGELKRRKKEKLARMIRAEQKAQNAASAQRFFAGKAAAADAERDEQGSKSHRENGVGSARRDLEPPRADGFGGTRSDNSFGAGSAYWASGLPGEGVTTSRTVASVGDNARGRWYWAGELDKAAVAKAKAKAFQNSSRDLLPAGGQDSCPWRRGPRSRGVLDWSIPEESEEEEAWE